MDVFGGSSQPTPAPVQQQTPAPIADLNDIFGGGAPAVPSQPVSQPVQAMNTGLGDIFSTPAPAEPVTPQINYFDAFEDQNIKLEMTFKRVIPSEHQITCWFSNKSKVGISAISLQIAVQKYMKMTLNQISSTDLFAES